MAEKRYYWLKLQEDFFKSKRIKKLRKIAGGDTFTIIYLKMQLLSIRNKGILEYSGLEPSFAEEIALDIDENVDDVIMTINYLLNTGLMETTDNKEYMLPFAVGNIGSESESAERVRQFRERESKAKDQPKQIAKTNAERQRNFRAKQICTENGHIPLIEDHMNAKRYAGNYYLAFKRDKCKCVICNSNENLCMHHIDGYKENDLHSSDLNKLVTLCRECHSRVHAGLEIPTEILESIDYYENYNEMLPSNGTVTKCNHNVLSISNSISSSISISDSIKEIVNYLNININSHYKSDTNKTINLIKARLKEGFTVEDFKTVIDKKVKAWINDPKMRQYLRPETLFGTKFEGYLNEPEHQTRAEEVDNWL